MTAAFELTRAEHRDRFEVTVYQMGWRLGGKGASGRGPADRIEEHGLHLWMGWYENAFRLMRECYRELGRDPRQCRVADWTDAFEPAPVVGLADRLPNGGWETWLAHFPAGAGAPGDPLTERNPFTVRGYLGKASALVVELLRAAHAKAAQPAAEAVHARRWPTLPSPEDLVDVADSVLRYGQLATAAATFEAADLLRAMMEAVTPLRVVGVQTVALRLIDAIAQAARRQLELVTGGDVELRRVWEVIDIILASLRGSVLCGLAFHPQGFDAINDQDWREWLRANGASQRSLDSAFMRGNYDLLFGYEDGDPSRPALAAGVAMRGALRMFFTYRGALFYRMTAGMGDIVFAPLYEVLKRRGVRFEFFHRLRNVRLAPRSEVREGEKPWVAALDFDVQAKVKDGGEYDPLVDVRGLPCWPSQPKWELLDGGDQLRAEERRFEAWWDERRAGTRTLEVTRDFDFVVLGTPVATLPHVAGELLEREPRWRRMVEHVPTVPTQALQLWLREDMSALGWTRPAVNLAGFVEPFDTWADMRHLLREESFTEPVRAIAYFCNVLSDRPAPGSREEHAAAHAEVRANAVKFLDEDVGALWPGAALRGAGFRYELLVDEEEARGGARKTGQARIDSQHLMANVGPSDRYTQSLPGTIRYRVSPLDGSFDNLTICGDWTGSGLNTGCIESAVMSGLLAAHALAGTPALEEIIGYDHP
jgi:uncharacterized protein with NAD-binding domain and iron-sulfur cluster